MGRGVARGERPSQKGNIPELMWERRAGFSPARISEMEQYTLLHLIKFIFPGISPGVSGVIWPQPGADADEDV